MTLGHSVPTITCVTSSQTGISDSRSHSQLRCHVEACCLPWTQHIGANHGEQKEMNTGIYPYFIFNNRFISNHQLTQPVRYHLVINFTGFIPRIPERNCDKFKRRVESHGINRNQDTEDLLLICRNQDNKYLLFIPTGSA